jgi:rhamnose utilization protein RhaD (predicted bifunctional aldolase and dehydrogenase)
MKKSELKSKAKAETKKIEKAIETGLIDELKTVIAKLGKSTDKLAKQIGKGSKKLAKKIAKEVKLDQPAKLEKATPDMVIPQKTKPITANNPPKNKKNNNAAKS